MKIIIQHCDTSHFHFHGQWITDSDSAQEFETSTEALTLIRNEKLHPVRIVMKLEIANRGVTLFQSYPGA